MENLEIMTKCGHCSNVNNAKVKAFYNYHVSDAETDSEHRYYLWLLAQCSVCSRPILAEIADFTQINIEGLARHPGIGIAFENWGSYDSISPALFENCDQYNSILYPIERNLSEQWNLPPGVRKAYSKMLRVKNVEPNSFAILVGKTLEAVCINEKAQGKTLAEQIKNLADSGRIPPKFADIASQLRILRNVAAHMDSDDEISEEDVPIIHDFIDTILEYLYIVPSKLTRLQARVDKKKKS